MTNLEIYGSVSLPTEDEALNGVRIDKRVSQILSVYDAVNGRSGQEPSRQRMSDLLESFEHQTAIVAVDKDEEDEVVGVANVRFEPDQAFIEGIAVHPDWRREGVGEELMKYIEQSGYRRQLGCVALRSIPSVTGFYEKLGYDYVSDDDVGARLPLMRKQL